MIDKWVSELQININIAQEMFELKTLELFYNNT